MVRLLIVEDDIQVVGPLSRALNTQGYAVAHVADGNSALEKIKIDPPDLVLLDVTLPDIDGFKVCEEIRRRGIDFPILMMTGCADSFEVVHGLDSGADDYLVKPFDLNELFARLRALSRRAKPESSKLTIDNVVIDRKSRLCTVDGVLIGLTHTEFDLLNFLMCQEGRAVKRNLIIREIWNTNWFGPTKNLDMHISSLRRKLGAGSTHLKTVRGVGFRFDKVS
jgi:DNA-binding response OmpR family regulator